ncbi:MAG: hypothetical protein M1483_05150 [Actinobacteria bacterium]|jgi:hypothetical protein|nr:hypothetical protein [Actinomycetota bacterium]
MSPLNVSSMIYPNSVIFASHTPAYHTVIKGEAYLNKLQDFISPKTGSASPAIVDGCSSTVAERCKSIGKQNFSALLMGKISDTTGYHIP